MLERKNALISLCMVCAVRFWTSLFFSSWWEPAAQPCALDHSPYSRRAQKKSTSEANYFCFNSLFISIPGSASRGNSPPPPAARGERLLIGSAGPAFTHEPGHTDYASGERIGRVSAIWRSLSRFAGRGQPLDEVLIESRIRRFSLCPAARSLLATFARAGCAYRAQENRL